MYCSYKNLAIRNATAEDAVILSSWWNDGTIMAHTGFPDGIGTSEEKVAESLRSDTDDTKRRLLLLADHEPVGEMC